LNIKAVYIGNVMLLYSDSERSVEASSPGIFRSSMSKRDNASATTFFFPGSYPNDSPYSSSSNSQHKAQSEAFKPVKVLFLWSVKTMIG
jgi:hypothetical protein